MPRETQGRILRVLVDQRFRRLGGDTDVQVDVRVVSSTARKPARRDCRGPFPRGPLSPAQCGAPCACRGCRNDARTSPNWWVISSTAFRRPPAWAQAPVGRGRHRHPPDARLARQRPPTAQQRRAAADPSHRRSQRDDHRRNAAVRHGRRRRRWGSVRPERDHRHAVLRDAREVFEREQGLTAQILRGGSVVISRVPQPSSGWIAWPCTGSLGRWASPPFAAAKNRTRN